MAGSHFLSIGIKTAAWNHFRSDSFSPWTPTEEPAMKTNFAVALLVLSAGLSLAACNKPATDAKADAVRAEADATAAQVDTNADTLEKTGENQAAAIEGATDTKADAMRNTADAIEKTGEKQADAIEDGAAMTTSKDGSTVTTTTVEKK